MLTSSPASRKTTRCRAILRRLGRDRSGVSIMEFALYLPIFVGLGMGGMELANMATTYMQVSQIALSVADNASRLGQTDNSTISPTIAEADVDAVMFGALQQGAALDFELNGRIILSSLEVDDGANEDSETDDSQYIHWQRCAGELAGAEPSYGEEEDEVEGIGREGLTANPGQAVMFAEVFYTYQPLFAGMFFDNVVFRQEAAFIVRDDRDLDPNGDGLTGTTRSTC